MTAREGNLEAPTRHPVDWKNPDFYDEAKCFAEMERIFDICHGCRRCVSLCGSFPTLFDLVDAGPSGEVDGVQKADYWKVVDQCYLCDVCYMTKCPYVPPHPWNLDFPHLMLRAKAVLCPGLRVALAVDPVQDDQARQLELLRGLPHLLGLHLDARDRVHDDEGRGEHRLEPLSACGERASRPRRAAAGEQVAHDVGGEGCHQLPVDLVDYVQEGQEQDQANRKAAPLVC